MADVRGRSGRPEPARRVSASGRHRENVDIQNGRLATIKGHLLSLYHNSPPGISRGLSLSKHNRLWALALKLNQKDQEIIIKGTKKQLLLIF
jgi:hypothetical protein